MPTPPRGLLAEVLTPLADPGRAVRLDRKGLTTLIMRCVPHCQALLVAGPLCGQGLLLDRDAWREVVSLALELVPPELPLLVGLSAPDSEATLERAAWLGLQPREHRVWGLDLALYHHSNRGLPAYLGELAAALGRPVLLMNHPGLVGARGSKSKRANLMASVVAKCAASGVLAGLVYAGSLRLGLSLQRALRQEPGQEEPVFYDGEESAFLARPASGGVLSQGAGLLPQDWALVAGQSLASGQAPEPAQRRELMAAAARVSRLAELLAQAPAAIAAYLAHRAGLIASHRSLAPPPGVRALAAAETWAQEQEPQGSLSPP